VARKHAANDELHDRIGFAEARVWNQNRRMAEMLPSSARKCKL
jgi:hypothetical protein